MHGRSTTSRPAPGRPVFLDVARRDFFAQALGVSGAALASLDGRDPSAAEAGPASRGTNPLAAKAPPRPARARAVIHLHMIGAPSQLDLLDSKPALSARDGQPCPAAFLEGLRLAFIGETKVLRGSPSAFARHGRAGIEMSELLPHLAGVADDICVVRGVHTDEINHAPAQMFLHTGFGRGGRPTLGAWTTYGLGSEGARTAPGRDHHAAASTMWLAGGGVRAGHVHGTTDELGFSVVEHPVHVHDLNATILHLLGFDHEKLTFRHQGREYRLTDVHGRVVRSMLA